MIEFMNDNKYMVFISCMTFNHAYYIEDALDGFCMQQTDFPFLCCIVDDASTDGTQEVIRQYIDRHFVQTDSDLLGEEDTTDYCRVFAQHKTNKNCFLGVFYLKYNHHQIKKSKLQYVASLRECAKYIAICEGDDYWIDPLKLKKQVDFLESHPQHSLCFCANKILFPSGETKDVVRYSKNKEVCPMNDIIMGGGDYMATNSMLYRNSMYVSHRTWTKNCPVGDIPIMLTLAHAGSFGYIADIMCVYRKAAAGSWTQRMASDIKKRHAHHKAIMNLWSQFDKYTNYQYHDTIAKKKRINRKSHRMDMITSVLSLVKKTIIGRRK